MTDVAFALWLLRSAHGWTQGQVAQRIHATRQQVTDWEAGVKLPTVASFARICRGLEVSPASCLQIAEGRDAAVLLKKQPRRVESVKKSFHEVWRFKGRGWCDGYWGPGARGRRRAA